MFDIFGSTHSNKQRASTLINEYIQRNANEFLNPIKTYPSLTPTDFGDDDLTTCWSRMLELNKSTFLKGWKPTTNQYNSLYDQLFHHYFDYPTETEKAIRSLERPLQWFPLQWFSNAKALSPSGRMGPVYIMSCKIPHRQQSKTMIIREINLCMVKQQQEKLTIPNRVIGITAVPSKHKAHHYKLAFVSFAMEHSLEQLIPQVDQWTFQKTCRLALSLASAVRDLHKRDLVHPNLQPRNVLISNIYDEHALKLELVDGQDDWPSIPLSTRYGRYPYISPDICYDYANTITKQSNMYSLGIMFWQLVSGVIFPNTVAVCPEAYQITLPAYVDPAYRDLVLQCLSKDSENRPTAETVCEALVRIIMSDMTFRTSTSTKISHMTSAYAHGIRERQMVVAKYLIHCRAKSDLEELMQGASLSKRMTVHVLLSLQWRSNITHSNANATAATRPKCYSEEEDTCEDVHGRYIPACVNRKKQKYQKRVYRIAPAKEVYCGADLPDLMQMGMV